MSITVNILLSAMRAAKKMGLRKGRIQMWMRIFEKPESITENIATKNLPTERLLTERSA